MSAGRHRGPILFLESSTLISAVGNGVMLVALPWLVIEQTGSAGAAGLVSAAALLPLLVSSVFAGPWWTSSAVSRPPSAPTSSRDWRSPQSP